MVVDVGEKVVHGFDLGEPIFVDARGGELFVEGDKAEEMVLDSFLRILRP